MLRRTLILFSGFVLLVLAITVGYALLGLSGPRTAIADADHALAHGRLAEAVRLLDVAERTLTASDQEELLPRILRRRYRAHHKLGNVPAARRDIDNLLALTKGALPEPDVAVEHIEIMLDDDQPETALEACRSLLERVTGANRARTLELAGEAHQSIYQQRVKALVQTLDGALGESSRQRAVTLLKSLLYRSADDPVATRAQTELVDLVRHGSARPVSLEGWQGKIDEIRAGIQQALAYFRQSLENADGKPVAAYRGLVFALEQSGRLDDRHAVQDLYLLRFDHPETVYAAIAAAEERLAAGDDRGTVAVAERYLKPGTALERARTDRLPAAVKRLIVAQALALHHLDDQPRLDALAQDVVSVHESNLLDTLPEWFIVGACQRWKMRDEVPRLLKDFLTLVAKKSATDGYDPYQIGIDLLTRWLSENGDPRALGQALDDWCLARPNDLRARRMRCEHLLAIGQAELAVNDALLLIQHRSHDDAALALYTRAVDEAAKATNRDAATVLARLIARGSANPTEPHDPAIYLALGELAMKNKFFPLAGRCGQLAAQAFTWAEWPRRMTTEAMLRAGAPLEALRAAEAYREFFPDSDAAVRSYVQALPKAERNDPSLLFDTALRHIASPEMAATLLTAAIARDQRALLPALCRRSLYRYGTDARVLLRVAVGFLAANRTSEAREVLLNIPVAFPDDHPACVEAATRFLQLEAKDDPTSPLLGMAVKILVQHARDAKTLEQVADELEQVGQPALVLAVLAPLLEDEANVEGRNGRVFALAGRACLALDQTAQAEVYLTGALAFEDGREAAPSLALLWLLQKRPTDAESAMWQTEAVDEASACLLLSLGRTDAAVRWARARLRESRLDVTAMLLLAIAGTPDDKRTVPADFHALVRKESAATLRTITLMAMPGFQVMGEKAASELRQRLPASPLAWFLYARALARAGERDHAVAELTELTQKTPDFLPAFDEVLRITDGGLHGDISKIGPLISNSVVTAPFLATPRMRAMVGEAFATQIGLRNHDPGHALPMLARLWIQFPQESRAGIENVAVLATRGRTDDAFELLRQLEGDLPASERSRFLDFYFTLGRALVKNGETKVVAELDAKAHHEIDVEKRPFGSVVHYLVDRLEETRGPFRVLGQRTPQAAEAEALLIKHLDFVPSLQDLNNDLCLGTIARLEQIDSADQVLARIDDLLHRDPSLLPVWIRRAQLLEARDDIDEALRSLRWIIDYVAYEPAILELARIAGEHDRLSANDLALIDAETTPTLAGAPAAAFPLGLVALRRGQLESAADLLARAPARADGGHLYFAGIVALARDAFASAREAFAAVAEGYASSPHALYAGHLAEQLAQLIEAHK